MITFLLQLIVSYALRVIIGQRDSAGCFLVQDKLTDQKQRVHPRYIHPMTDSDPVFEPFEEVEARRNGDRTPWEPAVIAQLDLTGNFYHVEFDRPPTRQVRIPAADIRRKSVRPRPRPAFNQFQEVDAKRKGRWERAVVSSDGFVFGDTYQVEFRDFPNNRPVDVKEQDIRPKARFALFMQFQEVDAKRNGRWEPAVVSSDGFVFGDTYQVEFRDPPNNRPVDVKEQDIRPKARTPLFVQFQEVEAKRNGRWEPAVVNSNGFVSGDTYQVRFKYPPNDPVRVQESDIHEGLITIGRLTSNESKAILDHVAPSEGSKRVCIKAALLAIKRSRDDFLITDIEKCNLKQSIFQRRDCDPHILAKLSRDDQMALRRHTMA